MCVSHRWRPLEEAFNRSRKEEAEDEDEDEDEDEEEEETERSVCPRPERLHAGRRLPGWAAQAACFSHHALGWSGGSPSTELR